MTSTPHLVFLHLFKCGGTSVIHRLKSMVGEDHFYHFRRRGDADALLDCDPDAMGRFVAIGGHMGWSYLSERFPDARKVTVLRDPVDRLISQYFHFRKEHEGLDGTSPPLVAFRARFCAGHSFADYALSDDDRLSRFTRNFMTRTLAGAPASADPDDPALYETARANLARFDLVGLSDRLDATFYGRLAALIAGGDAATPPPSRDRRRTEKNVSAERKNAEIPIADEAVAAILERNGFDIRLYQTVKWFGVIRLPDSQS